MAKGQKRSTREKKKPKANKKVVVPASSGLARPSANTSLAKARGRSSSARLAHDPE